MDDNDSAKTDDIPIGVPPAYSELYPTIVPRLREALRSASPDIRRRIEVLKVALDAREAQRLQRLTLTFRLTRTEARLAIYLANGGSLPGYAELFGVGLGTAKTHLKSVYAKTGVNRQPDLMTLAGRS